MGIALALFVRFSFNFNTDQWRHGGQDFGVYVLAQERLNAGISPYISSEELPYKYSPAFLIFFSALPSTLVGAWQVYCAISILGFLSIFFYGGLPRRGREVLGIALGVLLAWKGILECLDFGQIELILFFVAAVAALGLERLPFLCGALIGFLPLVKLNFVFLFVPYFLRLFRNSGSFVGLSKAKTRFSAGVAIAFLSWSILLPLLYWGPSRGWFLTQEWIASLREQPASIYMNGFNQSIWTSIARWGSLSKIPMFVAGSAVVSAFFLLAVRSRRQWAHPVGWVTSWLLLNQMLSPLAWRWGSVYLALLGTDLVSSEVSRQKARSWWLGVAILGVLFLLQQTPIVGRLFGVAHWTDLHPWGVITFYWIAAFFLSL